VARRTFDDNDQAILLVTARPGVTFDSYAGLLFLKQLHRSLEEVAGVDKSRLRSLASLLDPFSGTSLVDVSPYLEEIPSDSSELRALTERIHESSLAPGLFLSTNGEAAAFYIPAARGQSRDGLLKALEGWVERQESTDFELRLTGPLTAEVLLGKRVLQDLARLIPLMVAVIAGMLFFCLRSLGSVVVAMSEVLLVLTWTLGAMGYSGVPITLVTTILPVLLMTVAVTDEIHLLDRFRVHLAEVRSGGIAAGRTEVRLAMEAALRDVARPIVLTSLTTSIAFLSFLSAAIAPIQHLGLFTSLGVLLAMVLSFTFVPALVLLLPGSWFAERSPWRERMVPIHERLVVRRRTASAAFGVLLVLISVPGLRRLSIQDSWIDNFDPDSPLVSAERDFNSHFWGSYRFDVVLTSDEVSFRRPEGLRVIEEITPIAEAGPHVGGVLSHLIAFEIVAGALEETGRLSALPPERVSYLAYLLDRIRHRIDLDQLMPYNGRSARLRIFVRSPDYRRGQELEEYLEREIPATLAGRRVSYYYSGDLPVAGAVVRAIVTNMLRSVGWTAAGVCLFLVIAFRSFRMAAIAMAPLLAGIPILLGAMGYAGMPLGIATSMFLAVTIGVAVDYALHFSYAYRRGRHADMDHESALTATLTSAGRAIRWNAGVLALGMLILALSTLMPNRSLGLLLSAAMTTCYGTTLVLLPLLLEKSRAFKWSPADPVVDPSGS
jgi:predicted RND superfamily exporter protein